MQHTKPSADEPKRGRGRPRKVVQGDESREWLRPASAARLLDLPRSSMSDMMHGRAQVREPLVIKYLPSGQARISRASVLAQLAGVALALAVEQFGSAIVSPQAAALAGMGLTAGKVLATGAGLDNGARIGGEWGRFAGSVGDMPTGRCGLCVGKCGTVAISPVISLVGGLTKAGFDQGGEGVGSGSAGGLGVCIPPRRIISHWPSRRVPIDIAADEEPQHKEARIT